MTAKQNVCGLLVSEAVAKAAYDSWPRRPPTGYSDDSWASACKNHVLLVAREHGEDPDVVGLEN